MIRPATTRPHSTVTRAVTESLGDAEGRLPAGTSRSRRGTAGRQVRAAHRPATTVRPAVGPWRCDSCGESGRGWRALDAHSGVTGHVRATATDWRGLEL